MRWAIVCALLLARRAALVASYGFDGLDVDWEHPGGGLAPGRPEDTQNFTALLGALRTALAPKPRKPPPRAPARPPATDPPPPPPPDRSFERPVF